MTEQLAYVRPLCGQQVYLAEWDHTHRCWTYFGTDWAGRSQDVEIVRRVRLVDG